MKKSVSINPATGERIAEYERLSPADARRKIEKTHRAFHIWRETGFAERGALFLKLADMLEARKEEYARLAAMEMGKIIEQGRKEIAKCALTCRYYAQHAESFLAHEETPTEARKSYVAFSPLGVILGVMPWNFPFFQVVRFATPALMAGNAGALKHASNVQGCAEALEQVFLEAGFPDGLFSNLNVDSADIDELIADPFVAAVTLTGSENAGRSVAALAGRNLKKTVLELGGCDAYIILEDADLEKAVDQAVLGRMQNTGQTCVAAKRFIVLEELYGAFAARLTEKMVSLRMGSPLEEGIAYGPMARRDLRDDLHEQVLKTIAQGARLLCGGQKPEGPGAFYPATVLADVAPGMTAFEEELFGPVAAVVRARNEEHAIALANDSRFGLGSGVVTADVERGERVALRLEAGNSFVNAPVVSDPRLPFGGIKCSGYGRELSRFGIREFVNVKTVWIA